MVIVVEGWNSKAPSFVSERVERRGRTEPSIVSPIPTPTPVFLNISADVFVLQYHFENDGNHSLDDWYGQLRRYKEIYGPGILPSTLLWRVPPASLRGTGKWPPLSAHVECIKQIVALYAGSLAPRLVYYPDVEAAYASLWGTTPEEVASLTANPPSAVYDSIPRDFTVWNHALEAAGVTGGFPEFILELDQAPLEKPLPPALVSDTMIRLREHPALKKTALSLTPDFSVTGGRCKMDIADDCSLFVGNRSQGGEGGGVPGWPAGTYYSQLYNIYEELTQSVKPINHSVVLTDVTPWAEKSPGAGCEAHKTATVCVEKRPCCEWSRDGGVCQPRTTPLPNGKLPSSCILLTPTPPHCNAHC